MCPKVKCPALILDLGLLVPTPQAGDCHLEPHPGNGTKLAVAIRTILMFLESMRYVQFKLYVCLNKPT